MQPATPFNVFNAPLIGVYLIEASAGTGKTWNICGLYLRLLLERKLSVQQILVVTFTNAATAELRTRIRARLRDMLAHLTQDAMPSDDPFIVELTRTLLARRDKTIEELRLRIETALLNFDDAAIFTIHSFCQRALADTAFASGQAFSVELAPNDSDVRMEVVRDFWRTHVANADISSELAAYLIAQNFSPEYLDALLKRRLSKPLAHYRWPENETVTIDVEPLRAAYDAAKREWHERHLDIVDQITASKALNKKSYSESSIRAAASDYEAFFEQDSPSALEQTKSKRHLFCASVLKEKTNKNNLTPQHPFFELADTMHQAYQDFEASLERARLQLIRRFLDETPGILRQLKRERQVQAFDDLLFNLQDALKNDQYPWLVELVRQRFPAALVDEFQDTDPLQYEIFQTLYNGQDNTLYMVGDPKQAIYRFRNADLHSYLLAKQHARNIFTISHNQRSTDALIQGLNHLFQSNPQAFMLPQMEYVPAGIGEKRPLPFLDRSAPNHDAPLRLWQLPTTAEEPLDRSTAMRRATEATANEIARLLAAASAGKLLIDGRPLQASQIAVLVRNRRQGSRIKQALAALHVGSVELSPVSVFASIDAEEIERLLCAIWNPSHLGLLRAALSTELMGCDAGIIASLPDDADLLMSYIDRFSDYRNLWLTQGVGTLIRQVLRQEAISARLLVRQDGERRMTDLLHLTELLHQAGETHALPDSLLRWLQTRRAEAGNESVAEEMTQLRLESDRNLVQILTVHKSKGLEFPIVFCPFLWDGYRQRAEKTDGREYHVDDGSTLIDFCSESKDDPAIDALLRMENDAEDLRLIYVALTRAIYRCYLIAGCYRSRNTTNESHTSLLNWLVAGQDLSPQEWANGNRNKMIAANIEKAWEALAKSSNGSLALTPLPTDRAVPLAIEIPQQESLSCQPLPQRIPFSWRLSSFSGLTRGATHENAASDYDMIVPHTIDGNTGPLKLSAEHDILNFPKGTNAGLCFHRAFELCDFSDANTWHSAIDTALSEYPQSTLDGKAHGEAMMRQMMEDVFHTPLANDIRLCDIRSDKRLNEMEFYLPASGFSMERLNATLKRHGYPPLSVAFNEMACYMKGFIDLVFEHAGRYYLLDWKSNHLGHTVADYDANKVGMAMHENAYHLQYLLYTIALHRYLSQRDAGYRYDRDFGGVFYLFVRGMRPDWKNADGTPAGVFFDRPSPDTLAALDALFTAFQNKAA